MEKISRKPSQPYGPENPRTTRQNDSRELLARGSMTNFWVLREPDGDDAERREAKWDESDLLYEKITCPIDPAGHRRAGARISRVSVILPNVEPHDFVWFMWDCLVQEPVLRYFHDEGFTGFEAVPARARF